ncbi:hypothetical protein FRC03_003043 [Tulasnella sp. 419]|nr:hypothetical protein FRC03_003043 [Tulasnella sp. 419]
MQPSSSKGYGKVASGLIRSLSLEETSMDGSQQKSQEKPRKPTRKKATPIFEDVPSSPPSPEPARVLPRTQRNEKNREILLGHKGTPARETKKSQSDDPLTMVSRSLTILVLIKTVQRLLDLNLP